MEFEKKEIRTSTQKAVKHVQITLDKDMNVPDNRPDVEKLIQNKGEIRLEEIEVYNDKIRVRGTLRYRGLYAAAEEGPAIHSLSTSFEIDEYINVDGMTPSDTVKITAELDDLNVLLIHSRKIGIRALITFRSVVNGRLTTKGIVHGLGEQVEELKKELAVTELAFHKRDTCRLNAEMILPASKPNIQEIIWEESTLRNTEVRLLDGKVKIRGELVVFFFYHGEEAHVPLQHMEWEIPFQTETECLESRESMVGQVSVKCKGCHPEVRPDQDGEERVVHLEIILELDMKGYEEKNYRFLQDIYHINYDVEPEFSIVPYQKLMIKNNARTKIQRRIRLPKQEPRILQLIHVDGTVKLDETEPGKDGIYVEGVLFAELLFITEDDKIPLMGMTQMIPFSNVVETGELDEQSSYEMEASVEQIHATMPDGEGMELKAVISLNTIAFLKGEEKIMTDVKEQEKSYEKQKEIPGIAVYLADREEPLWNVAKAYGAGMEEIKKLNHLEGDMLFPGQKLLIVKKGKELAI